ncbi:MAG: exosortase X [Bacteroidia bacterium]
MLFSILKKPLYQFLLRALGFYVFWYLVYELWLHPYSSVDIWVVKTTMNTARYLLDMLGFATFGREPRLIGIDGTPGLWMGDNCDSIELCAIFSGFIIAFPGFWKHKLWYIPLGWILITFMNILRIIALALIQRYCSRNFLDFNHTYAFTILVYGFIFILWFIWIKRITDREALFLKK